jgi:hypothetical protein
MIQPINQKKKIIGAASIVIVFVLIGTLGYTMISSDTISAAQIKSSTLQAASNITSYRFTMEMETKTTTSASLTGASSYTSTFTGTGEVDVSNQKLMMQATISMSMGTTMTMNALYYFLDKAMYMNMDYAGMNQWIKTNMSTNISLWNTYNQLQSQIALLQQAKVEKLPDETINGVPCYVLKITPDITALLTSITNQQGISLSQTQIPISSDLIKTYTDMIKSCTVKLWTAKDTNYIMQVNEQITMDMNIMSMVMSMTIHFTDYNIPLTIELPAEAANAIPYEEYLKSKQGS